MVEDHYIYSIDLSKKITPIMVRDAIIDCFTTAQADIVDAMMLNTSSFSEDKIKKISIDFVIKSAFKNAHVDFYNPTKNDLIMVIAELKSYAKQALGNKNIIDKHTDEIYMLIDKLET